MEFFWLKLREFVLSSNSSTEMWREGAEGGRGIVIPKLQQKVKLSKT
jgi:hypothetical protein